MSHFDGKIAVVTGAGSGFGRALVLGLAQQGATPVLVDKNPTALAQTQAMLGDAAATAMAQVVDISDAAAMQACADAVMARYGRVDILINNAGMISRPESFLDMDEAHSRLVFDVNYWGTHNGARAFVPYLARQQRAALVNVASSMGVCACPLHSSYCASKAASIAFTEVLRQELRDTSIRVTLVLPGAAKTNLGRNIAFDDPLKREQAAKNFERFARTSPDTVARKIIDAIRTGRHSIATGLDGNGMVWMARYLPRSMNRLMNTVYRRTVAPDQFVSLAALGQDGR